MNDRHCYGQSGRAGWMGNATWHRPLQWRQRRPAGFQLGSRAHVAQQRLVDCYVAAARPHGTRHGDDLLV